MANMFIEDTEEFNPLKAPLCKNCKNFRERDAMCNRPTGETWNPVWGIQKEYRATYALLEREPKPDSCGPLGRFYKKGNPLDHDCL